MMNSVQKILISLLVLSLFGLQGCVSRTPIAQEEWRQMVKAQHMDEDDRYHTFTKRVIEDKSTDEVLAASRELFMLMDKKDMEIEQTENGVSAKRDWFLWALMVSLQGYDYWGVTTYPTGENGANTLVTVAQASETMGQTAGFGAPVGGVSVTAGGGNFSTKAKLYREEAAYQLFWLRLEYLLGLHDEWISCKEAGSWAEKNGYEGKLRAMCEFTSDDTPEGSEALTQASE